MRDWLDNLFIAAGTIIAGLLSWAAAQYAQKRQARRDTGDLEVERSRTDNEHTQIVLGGYSRIVDDLREEIKRLNDKIVDLRKEQEECERRNDALESIVFDLQRRLANLEIEKANE
jgi:uncharacterized coiled-coil DUF342 family protein